MVLFEVQSECYCYGYDAPLSVIALFIDAIISHIWIGMV